MYSRMISYKADSDPKGSEGAAEIDEASLFGINRTLQDRRRTDCNKRSNLKNKDILGKRISRKNTDITSNNVQFSPIKQRSTGKEFKFKLAKVNNKPVDFREAIKKIKFVKELPTINAPPLHYDEDEKHESYWEVVASEILNGNKNMMKIYT
ncbi:unnamed protein product [Moneuplotes crassus]|uniref:Uncharacterized protein n=1 Tax=Euplotes crassus TaxID=5936 RepID=A0AAD1X207_EUPCR|nr:unnamed protein product [Moneuplotes crassus]